MYMAFGQRNTAEMGNCISCTSDYHAGALLGPGLSFAALACDPSTDRRDKANFVTHPQPIVHNIHP